MKRRKAGICLFICMLLLSNMFVVNAAKEQEPISDKEYLVSLQDANSIFISNDKPVSGEVGSMVFLTYTVEKVTKNVATQNGVIATMDSEAGYPYLENGRLDYSTKSQLFEEGYTYVYRFERTEEGYSYQCAMMKGEEAKNITFTLTSKAGDSDAYKYYGVWTDGTAGAGVSAILNHVRCFDQNGNDLGVHFNRATGMLQDEVNTLLDVHLTVDTSYGFTLDKVDTIAIGNKYATKNDVVYMEYEVADVVKDDTIQQGVIVTESLQSGSNYPHGGDKGLLLFKALEKDEADKPLLRKGAKYFICFSKKAEGYEAVVQCTLNGKTETFSFPYTYGAYKPEFQYFALWFGDGKEHTLSATFENFRCYDAEGNNLGVQITRGDIPISLSGETEDYSKSKAVYYCKETNGFLVLADDRKVSKQVGADKEEGTYKILNRDELYLIFESGKETYSYTSLIITDDDGNEYKRMKNATVTFVTGDETIQVQTDAANGYRVTEPEKPNKDGNTFKGWFYRDETAFDFDTVVTESITLYAKWEDGNGNEYFAQETSVDETDHSMIIAIVISATILSACICGGFIIVRKGKKHGNKKETN